MRRNSFGAAAGRMMRAAAQAERARQRDARQQAAASRRQQQLAEKQARLTAKERALAYSASREEEARDLTAEIADREQAIDKLLSRSLERDPRVKPESLKQSFRPGALAEDRWSKTRPVWEVYEPKPLSFLGRLVPGSKDGHRERVEEAKARFDKDVAWYDKQMAEHERRVAEFEAAETVERDRIASFNAEIDQMLAHVERRDHQAVVRYYGLLLDKSFTTEVEALGAEIGYSSESRHLVVDLELPDVDVIPEESGFKYIKSGDRIDPIMRPAAKRRTLYASLVSRCVLKAIDVVFRGGKPEVVDALTINGMLDTLDPATGQSIRICLVSVRVSPDTFKKLNLAAVEPEHCLRSLKASVSRSPAELLPVKPLVEINMVDPRFIETRDVMSGLDSRQNLMDLTPSEFEGLISQLFEAMGLETRQTQASRDGGVDCVAFDLRPIFGGKVVIQAKRYKGTVGVSAVRDLYGTMQNEGANRGILVTTSGYGKASMDFARDKPLELIDGGGLLHLLAEHAKIEARIVMPAEWTDRSNLEE